MKNSLFLILKRGMSFSEVESIMGRTLLIDEVRDGSFSIDAVQFKEEGVTLFFNPESAILETIKFVSPFPLAVAGTKIGDTTNSVKQQKGAPERANPFPIQESIIWIYWRKIDQTSDWIRIDFDKESK